MNNEELDTIQEELEQVQWVQVVSRYDLSIFKNRLTVFAKMDDNFNIIKGSEEVIAEIPDNQIVCDGCNVSITTDLIKVYFYIGYDNNVYPSRTICEKCYDNYYSEMTLKEHNLYNLCNRVLHNIQALDYNGIIIDIQSANVYRQVYIALIPENRDKMETMKITQAMAFCWSCVK